MAGKEFRFPFSNLYNKIGSSENLIDRVSISISIPSHISVSFLYLKNDLSLQRFLNVKSFFAGELCY